MARKPVVLISGAGGEIGHSLIDHLAEQGRVRILALDIREIPDEIRRRCHHFIQEDIVDEHLLERLSSEFEIHAIYHLAALLSTRCEFIPEAAHEVNVRGTLNLLHLAVDQSRGHGDVVRFFFPSSIAAYGLPDLATKDAAGAVEEGSWGAPITMYGCNKLSCEHLGRYYSRHYRQLEADGPYQGVDFRSIRFPGLISAITEPSGGTSDYLPEMIHAAAQGTEYRCFVREDTRISFMTMPDAVAALLQLMAAPADTLTTQVYNVTAFNPSAGEFAELVRGAFSGARIGFEPDLRRQRIVDSWPADVDASRARRDWGFEPAYDLGRAFDEYLVPTIKRRYEGQQD
jgi:nucleoside-diphosphate-sugar epimerase